MKRNCWILYLNKLKRNQKFKKQKDPKEILVGKNSKRKKTNSQQEGEDMTIIITKTRKVNKISRTLEIKIQVIKKDQRKTPKKRLIQELCQELMEILKKDGGKDIDHLMFLQKNKNKKRLNIRNQSKLKKNNIEKQKRKRKKRRKKRSKRKSKKRLKQRWKRRRKRRLKLLKIRKIFLLEKYLCIPKMEQDLILILLFPKSLNFS